MLLRLLIAVQFPVWFSPADDPGLMEHRSGIWRGMTKEQVEKMLGTKPSFGYCNGYFNSGSTACYPRGITVLYDGANCVKEVQFSK